MRQFPLLFVIACLLSLGLSAQSKTEFGVTTEGSWFIPGNYSADSPSNKNSIGFGFGVYASQKVIGKFSADLGVKYRYKQMKEFWEVSFPESGNYGGYSSYGGYGYIPYGYGYDYSSPSGNWESFSLHYVVIPFHIRYAAYRNMFVQAGMEASWLANYDTRKDKTEYNWTVGVGCQKYKLKWSLNYIRGFKDVGFANKLYDYNGTRSATIYKNNMLQLNLSYPIWQKK